ncbi:ribosomal rRNA methyltransferase Nop2 [Angomonas deanei]|nr:ribosomal rRNA methyltransferase Nop2 [Angomonas deanei]|eukprot:EPY28351.1 ribosomal rRNA methyltransferase Nop2 [Angomonas deanei]
MKSKPKSKQVKTKAKAKVVEEDFRDENEIAFDDVINSSEEEEEDFDADIQDDDEFEVKAEKYRRRMLAQKQLADAEQQEDIDQRTSKVTPLEDHETEGVQLYEQTHTAEELRDRVQEIVRVLTNFSDEREEGRSRAEYLELLKNDLMELYEYNEFLMDCIMRLFPPSEVVDFLEAMEKTRPTTIRVNTLKAKRRDLVQTLVKRGMNIEPLEKWSKVGLQVFESNVPIAGTIEYLAGYYMLQAAASFLPVMALAPQEGERILDMSAAPGGKTTYIAQLMKNTGVLFANDVSAPRCKSLNANLQRLGVTNCIVTNYDGTGYEKVMRNFDRILLDAPCTGTGIISRDKSIKTSKHYEDIQRSSQQQRSLLLSAIDACKVEGYIVYSTCSFLVEENEAVVDFALKRRNVKIVEMGLPFGRPGFTKYQHNRYDESLEQSRRYFPHVHNMDGFYVCKLKKISQEVPKEPRAVEKNKGKGSEKRPRAQEEASPAAGKKRKTEASSNISIPPKSTSRTPAPKKNSKSKK